jgi:hypothetical protein
MDFVSVLVPVMAMAEQLGFVWFGKRVYRRPSRGGRIRKLMVW